MDPINNSAPQKINDDGLVELAQKRQEEIVHKKNKFQKIMKVVRIGLVVLVLVFGIGIFFLRHTQKTTPPKYSVEEQNNNPAEIPTWGLYKSNDVRVFIQYPLEAKVKETSSPSLKVEIVFDSMLQDLTKVTDANLQQGYIFRVTPLNVGLRTIESISLIKQESFKLRCPATAVFSEITDKEIDGIKGKSFEINNCDSDYVVTYIPKFGIYYEIVQIFKGDFGYRQKYKATTDQMVTAFKFFPEGSTEPVGPFRTYISETNHILFIHPNLDEECCVTPAPPIEGAKKVVILGDRDTYIDNNNFDGVGVYLMQSDSSTGTFDEFIAKQKQFLIEDYKVVKGVAPKTEDIPIKIGTYDGIMLKGYSWRGNSLAYAQYEDRQTHQTFRIIFSIKNVSGEEFDKKVVEILNSFEAF